MAFLEMSSSRESLQELVRVRLGLDLSRRDPTWFAQLLDEQSRAAGLADPAEYLGRLRESETEGALWHALIDRLTIAETYFFRDDGQMELLRDQLLPGLLREARGRALRIWSAGCSTGEELYTIAMLLDGMAAPPADLIGTDLNPQVVEQARRGVYRERSLRNLPANLRSLYLQPQGRDFAIAPKLRQRTRFQVGNLHQDESAFLRGLDLIVCRNVLIYLDRQALPEVLDRFYRCLRPGGLLLTGHGELLSVETPFEVVAYPSSLVYRRPEQASLTLPKRESALSPPPDQVISEVGQAPFPESPSAERFLIQARAARLRGTVSEARTLLRQALYLDPDCGPVYLEMALLLALEDPVRARKHRATGLELMAGGGSTSGVAAEVARAALDELERLLP